MDSVNITVKPIQRRVLALNEEKHVSPTHKQKQALLESEHVSDTIKQAIANVSEDDPSNADNDLVGV